MKLILFLLVLVVVLPLVLENSFAVSFKDSKGYIPKWAQIADQELALLTCSTIDSSSSDTFWCKEYSSYVNAQLNKNKLENDNDSDFINSGTIQVSIDKQKYKKGDFIMISGRTQIYYYNLPVVIKIINPNGQTVLIDSSTAGTEKSFEKRVLTVNKIWDVEGKYVVQVSYGDNDSGEATFSLEVPKVPNWIKNNAQWWSNGSVDDKTFLSSIEFLIKENIMKISNITPQASASKEIPQWIKTNAGWWAADQISENEFISAIEYLVTNGIISIPVHPHPRTLLVTHEDLKEGWTIEEVNVDWKLDEPDHTNVHRASQNVKTKSDGIFISIINEYDNPANARKLFDDKQSTVVDQVTFSFDDSGFCIKDVYDKSEPLVGGIFRCYIDEYVFFLLSSPGDLEFYFMDKMLEKYYHSQGKEFNFSTKDFVNKGKVIPKREMSYEEKIDSLFLVEIIDCKEDGKYVNWKGSITSSIDQPVSVSIVLTGKDSNGNIITFEQTFVNDINPFQTKYIDRLLDNSPQFDTCGYKIEEVFLP